MKKYIFGFFVLGLCLLSFSPATASAAEQLTIIKNAVGASSSDSFPFNVTKSSGSLDPNMYDNGSSVGSSSSFNLDNNNSFTKTFSGFQNATTAYVPSPNNYTITESTPSGWNAPTISCSDTNPNSNQYSNISFNYNSPSVTFEYTPNAMVPGAYIQCTFTNTRVSQPTPTITTSVSAMTITAGTVGYDTSSITNAIAGTTVTYNLFAGVCPANASNVPIFTSTVNVNNNGTVPNSNSYTFNTSGSYYWVATYNAYAGAPGIDGPCEPLTVTPKASTTTLTVKKILVPATSTDKFTLEIFNSINVVVANFLNSGNGGILGPVPLNPGNYYVSELASTGNQSNYTNVYSGDCAPIGNITLNAGDNKTCIMTNTLIPKTTVGITTNVSSSAISTGATGYDTSSITNATPGTSVTYNLFAGSCPALASNVPIFTSTVNVNNNGTVPNSLPYTFVTAGSYYWVVTYGSNTPVMGPCEPLRVSKNVKPSKLKVVKKIIPGSNSGKFNLLIDGVIKGANKGHNGTTGYVTVSPGLHTVSETAGTNTNLSNYTTSYSANCAGGNITLSSGSSAICNITNRRKAKSKTRITTTLLPASTVIDQTPVTDTATISGATSNAGGTVQYKYFNNNSCLGVATNNVLRTVTNGTVPVSSTVTYPTPNTFPKFYSWKAVYSGDINNNGATSPCEHLTIKK